MNTPIETPAQAELRLAVEAQRTHVANMQGQFSDENLALFTVLNERVRRAQVDAESGGATYPTSSSTTRAQVTLVRAGKDEKVVDVNAQLTLRQVIENAGWDPSAMTVQKRTGTGSSQDVDIDQPVGEGTYEFLCNPKYAAGLQC